jgi:hypothetical protein
MPSILPLILPESAAWAKESLVRSRGSILVVLLLAAGLAAAAAAIWNQYRQTRRALEFWGPQVATLIGNAPSVEVTRLSGHVEAAPADGSNRPQSLDISGARGLVHFRHSLLEDDDFIWGDPLPSPHPSGWDFQVRFSDGANRVDVVFDLTAQVAANRASPDKTVRLTPKIASGLAKFFEDASANARPASAP